MKNYLLLFVLILVGCAKDISTSNKECKDCLNGGWCDDGEGACSCPLGFYGAHCEYQYLPTTAHVKTITITNYPLVNGVALWDDTTNADICVQLFQKGSNHLYTSDTLQDVPSNKPIVLHPNFKVDYIQDTIFVDLLDIDSVFVGGNYQGTSAQLIEYLDFRLLQYLDGQRPPEHMSQTINGCTIDIDMEYTY